MLNKLRIRNFKCFEDTGEIEIRPLTLLVGPNSSGKSSIMQFLLALRQTVESPDIQVAFAPNDSWVRLGSYPDFIFHHEWQRELEAMLEVMPKLTDLLPILVRSSRQPNKLRLKVRWRYNKKTTQIQLEESELVYGKFTRLLMRKAGRYEVIVKSVSEDGKEWRHEVSPVRFYEFAPREKVLRLPEGYPWEVLLPAGRIVELELRRLLYLGPLREFPQRSYVISGQAPSDVVSEAKGLRKSCGLRAERKSSDSKCWRTSIGGSKNSASRKRSGCSGWARATNIKCSSWTQRPICP